MNRRKFNYINNIPCNEPVKCKNHTDNVIIVNEDPNRSKDDYFMAYREQDEFHSLCHYHQEIMAGRIEPYHWSLIDAETQKVITKNRTIYENELRMKKETINGMGGFK
jgi:hypothetical protein